MALLFLLMGATGLSLGSSPATAATPNTAAVGCPVTDATLTWGFKESFRSYISGSIANGEWTLADGASYDIPNFGWSGGEGAHDNGEGLVAFAGAVTFTGHGGILNTTIANPQLRLIDEGTAVILLDVSGTTQDGATVDAPAVEFVELDLAAATIDEANGTITVTDAPSELTSAGAQAFGTYEAGEAFDPVSFTLPLDADCGSVLPVASPEASVNAAPASAEAPNLWWIGPIVALLLAAAAVTVVVIRRRSRTA